MRLTSTRSLPFLISALWATSISLSGQSPSAAASDTPTFKTGVNQVLVPVVVTDSRGRHIAGLKSADFTVFEDGVPQTIVGFASSHDPLPSGFLTSPPAGANANAMRLGEHVGGGPGGVRSAYVICVDTLNSAFFSFGRVRDALTKFFEQEQREDAQYTIVALGREPRVLQESTMDTKAILATLHDKSFTQSIRDSESTTIGNEAHQLTEMMKGYCVACGCLNYPKIRTEEIHCNERRASVLSFLNTSSQRSWTLAQAFADGLRSVTSAVAALPVSRTIILISDGFNRFPGRELYGIASAFGPRVQFPSNTLDTQPQLDAVIRLAALYNVRFYSLDSRGVYTQASLAGGGGFDASRGLEANYRGAPTGTPSSVDLAALSVARENTDALSLLASSTGGLFYQNNNDLLKGLRQAFADGNEYYILAYNSKASETGGYRKLRVTTQGSRYSVYCKAGFWTYPIQ